MAHAVPNNFARHTESVRRRLAESGMTRPGPGSVSWKVNQEVLAVAGWGRAILLQFAHPLVAEGVARHSHFSQGLAGVRRLASTIRAMLALTFGTDDEAIATAAGIHVIHDRVAGPMSTSASSVAPGTRYSAHDPRLLTWVHATLLDSLPLTFERLVGPLTAAERERYCEEAALMEPLMGIPPGTLPRSIAALDAYMTQMFESGAIEVTTTSRALATSVLHPPYGPLIWPAVRPVRLLTIGSLPVPIREAYGFPWTTRDERALDRWCSTIRRARRMLPRAVHEWPAARRAGRETGLTRASDRDPGLVADAVAPPSSSSRPASFPS